MAKYQVYPPEARDRGVLVHWVRIVHDDGEEHLEQLRERPDRPLENPSPIQKGEAMFQAWRARLEAEGLPQVDGGRMTASDRDYRG